MACPQWSEQISAWIDGMLTEQEREALEAHLTVCSDCHRTAQELRNLKSHLLNFPVLKPYRGMWNRVMRRVRQHYRLRRPVAVKQLVVWGFAFAASFVVAALLLFRPIFQNTRPAPNLLNTLASYHTDTVSLALSDNPMCHLVATAELSEAEGNE